MSTKTPTEDNKSTSSRSGDGVPKIKITPPPPPPRR